MKTPRKITADINLKSVFSEEMRQIIEDVELLDELDKIDDLRNGYEDPVSTHEFLRYLDGELQAETVLRRAKERLPPELRQRLEV